MATQALELKQVRLLGLQFNGSNPNLIPSALRSWLIDIGRETPEKRTARKSYTNVGVKVIEETMNCSLQDVPGELEAAGYELVDVIYEKRINGNIPVSISDDPKFYHMVRFLFAPRKVAEISHDFIAVRNTARDALRHICESAHWRVRGFLNPFYKDGEEVPGVHYGSINLEVREPIFNGDGSLRLTWQEDAGGKRKKLPLKPAFSLRVIDGAARLIAV